VESPEIIEIRYVVVSYKLFIVNVGCGLDITTYRISNERLVALAPYFWRMRLTDRRMVRYVGAAFRLKTAWRIGMGLPVGVPLGGTPHVVEAPQRRLGQDLKSLLADFETYRRGIRYPCG